MNSFKEKIKREAHKTTLEVAANFIHNNPKLKYGENMHKNALENSNYKLVKEHNER